MDKRRDIVNVLRERNGATFIVALGVLAICAVVAALVVGMAGAAAQRIGARASEQQARLAVSSALDTITSTIAKDGPEALGVYDVSTSGTTYDVDAAKPNGEELPRVRATLKRVNADVISVTCQLADDSGGYAYSLSAKVNTSDEHITAG